MYRHIKEKNAYIYTGLSFYIVRIEFQAHWRSILFLSSVVVRSLVAQCIKNFFSVHRRGFIKIRAETKLKVSNSKCTRK